MCLLSCYPEIFYSSKLGRPLVRRRGGDLGSAEIGQLEPGKELAGFRTAPLGLQLCVSLGYGGIAAVERGRCPPPNAAANHPIANPPAFSPPSHSLLPPLGGWRSPSSPPPPYTPKSQARLMINGVNYPKLFLPRCSLFPCIGLFTGPRKLNTNSIITAK